MWSDFWFMMTVELFGVGVVVGYGVSQRSQ